MNRNYEEYVEIVKHPGKFEREEPYVPYYYDLMLEGFANEDFGDFGFIFVVDQEDKDRFKEELKDIPVGQELGFFQDIQGFVYEVDPKEIRSEANAEGWTYEKDEDYPD